MNNYYNSNASPISHQQPIKFGSPNFTPFSPISPVGTIQQPPNHHPQALTAVFSGQMHEVVLEHLKVNDEVVWHPQGQILSINKLDIGRIERTLYHVDHSNQGALLADVDFVRPLNAHISTDFLPKDFLLTNRFVVSLFT